METRLTPPVAIPPAGEPVTRCLNCGAALRGAYCHVCGQEGVDRNLSLRALLHDFLGDFFSFDGRFFRTLRPLLTKPGALTSAYVAGHRVSYVPPMRLYVFSSFVLFLVITLLNIDPGAAMVKTGEDAADSTRTLTGPERAAIEAEMDSLRGVLEGTSAASPAVTQAQPAQADSFRATVGGVDVSDSGFGRYIESKGKRISDDPQAFQRLLASKIPLLLFLLVPIFASELKLLYVRQGKLYVQHLVFALHLHAFAFLLFMLLLLVEQLWEPAEFGFLLIPVYLFLALRRVYGQSYVKTFFKEFVLFGMHGISIALALTIYVFVLIAIY